MNLILVLKILHLVQLKSTYNNNAIWKRQSKHFLYT